VPPPQFLGADPAAHRVLAGEMCWRNSRRLGDGDATPAGLGLLLGQIPRFVPTRRVECTPDVAGCFGQILMGYFAVRSLVLGSLGPALATFSSPLVFCGAHGVIKQIGYLRGIIAYGPCFPFMAAEHPCIYDRPGVLPTCVVGTSLAPWLWFQAMCKRGAAAATVRAAWCSARAQCAVEACMARVFDHQRPLWPRQPWRSSSRWAVSSSTHDVLHAYVTTRSDQAQRRIRAAIRTI